MTRTRSILHSLISLTVIALVSITSAQQADDDTSAPGFNPVSSDRLLNAESEPQNWLM